MKRSLLIALTVACFVFCSSYSHALLLFSEDFESGLSAWTGKDEGFHSGMIVADPLDLTGPNQVLTFAAITWGGDIFTTQSFSSVIDQFRLSFDYLGLGDSDDLGGFVGYSYGYRYDYPGSMVWIAGAMDDYAEPVYQLQDTGTWQHVEIYFDAGDDIHLVLEDFLMAGPQPIPGDAYFDNIVLENPHPLDGSPVVPT
ncbi:hypothetical protein C6A36_01940, partial [Desulfobacteraceae bacterium SEEP-SAG10]